MIVHTDRILEVWFALGDLERRGREGKTSASWEEVGGGRVEGIQDAS